MEKQVEFILRIDESVDSYLLKNFKFKSYRILQKSLDARRANQGKVPRYNYRVLISDKDSLEFGHDFSVPNVGEKSTLKPVIIGAGPAGLFCALRLMDYGIKSIVLERGESSLKRMISISKYWRKGILDSESNVCFGEGGAGLFSDGKIYTRVKSPFVKYVLQKFVSFGADESIMYESNPHLGSHKIRKMIQDITKELLDFGSEVHFGEKVKDINFGETHEVITNTSTYKTNSVVLASGHSTRDFYEELFDKGLSIKAKNFAVGFRLEHSRKHIDSLQFGKFTKQLGAASYKLKHFDKDDSRGSFSFCMCPGGYVLSSGTDQGTLVTNGMSNQSHNSPWSNAAIVTEVKSTDLENNFPGVFGGFDFIESIEKSAYNLSKEHASGKELPAISLGEYIKNRVDHSKPLPKSSSPSRVFKGDVASLYPKFINVALRSALRGIERKLKGFCIDDALIMAPETRTSSPITILRDKETLESPSFANFYPCGEGAGYAGGITSAAIDGIKVAESIVNKLRK